MNYQQAGKLAIGKKILGWILFIPSVLSTAISMMNYLFINSDKQPGIDAVLTDFVHVMINMVKFNTPFLNFSGKIRQCPTSAYRLMCCFGVSMR